MTWLVRERCATDESVVEGVILTPEEVTAVLQLLTYSSASIHRDIVTKLETLVRGELHQDAQRWADDGGPCTR